MSENRSGLHAGHPSTASTSAANAPGHNSPQVAQVATGHSPARLMAHHRRQAAAGRRPSRAWARGWAAVPECIGSRASDLVSAHPQQWGRRSRRGLRPGIVTST